MSVHTFRRFSGALSLMLVTSAPAWADYQQDLLMQGYASNPIFANNEARYHYFGFLFPEVPSVNVTRSRFAWGVDVELEFKNGKIIQQNPSTGAILPAQLPELRSSVRLGQGLAPSSPPDFVSDFVYCSLAGGFQCPPNAAYTPLSSPTKATAGNQYDHLVQVEAADFTIGHRYQALATPGYHPVRVDVYLEATAPADHRLIFAPSVSSAKATVKEATWELDATVNKQGNRAARNQLLIEARAVSDDGKVFTVAEGARAMGYESINFINKITHSNMAIPPMLRFPKANPRITNPITEPVTDPPLGGVTNETGDGTDFEVPYYNVSVDAGGRAVLDVTHQGGAFKAGVSAEVAKSIVFQDAPGDLDPQTRTQEVLDVSFLTVMVGVRSTCSQQQFEARFPGAPTYGSGCFRYEVIGNKVFGWRSQYGQITQPLETPYFGPDGQPDPRIQFQSLSPLDDLPVGQPAPIDELTFVEFENRYGITPDQYFVQGLLPTRSPTSPVPEADALCLALSGLAMMGVLAIRRSTRHSKCP